MLLINHIDQVTTFALMPIMDFFIRHFNFNKCYIKKCKKVHLFKKILFKTNYKSLHKFF